MSRLPHPTHETAHESLRWCSYLFNNADLLADACHFHGNEDMLGFLNDRFRDARTAAPEDSSLVHMEVHPPHELLKLLIGYRRLFTPVEPWTRAGFSIGEYDFFLKNVEKARLLLRELQCAKRCDEEVRHTMAERVREAEVERETRRYRG